MDDGTAPQYPLEAQTSGGGRAERAHSGLSSGYSAQRQSGSQSHAQPSVLTGSHGLPPNRPQATGRPRDQVWHHFEQIHSGKQHSDAVCRSCGQIVKNAQPIKNLIPNLTERCRSVSSTVRQQMQARASEHRASRRSAISMRKRLRVLQHASGVSDDEDEVELRDPGRSIGERAFQLAVARVFFTCALPFVLVEHPEFQMLFKLLTPTLSLPTRHQLAGPLLTLIAEEYKAKVDEMVKKKRVVSLVTDAWTDQNSSSILNLMVVSPGMKSLFWLSLPTGTARHTAGYLTDQLRRVVADVQTETGAVAAAVLADNAKNIVSARRSIEQERLVFGGGYAAHVLNLLIHYICSSVAVAARVRDEAIEIARFVREHHAVLDMFRGVQRANATVGQRCRALVLPVPTRWYSTHACLASVLANKPVLREVFCCDGIMNRFAASSAACARRDRLQTLVESRQLWHRLKRAVRLLEPIVDALREVEADSSSTSVVYGKFRWLQNHQAYTRSSAWTCERTRTSQDASEIEYTQDDNDNGDNDQGTDGSEGSRSLSVESQVLLLVKKRWEFVRTPAMQIAFLLDPCTDLDEFMGRDKSEAICDACDYADRSQMLIRHGTTRSEFKGQLYQYADEKRSWLQADRLEHRDTSPRALRSCYKTQYPLLGELASLVFSIPGSSAASERAWSIFDLIHTRKRNRLSKDKVEALAFIYINHGAMSCSELDIARVQSHTESCESE